MAPNILAFLLSLCVLPLSFSLGAILFLWVKIRRWISLIANRIPLIGSRRSNATRPKHILLTGDDDEAILALARVLNSSGHVAYVVKQESLPLFSILRTSKAIRRFIGLSSGRLLPILRTLKNGLFRLGSLLHVQPKVHVPINFPGTVFRLIDSDKIDLWIPCDSTGPSLGSAQARDVVVKHSACQIFGPGIETSKLARGYSNFAQHVRRMGSDVQCPRTLVVRSRSEIHDLLSKAPKGQRFFLERSLTPQRGFNKGNSGNRRDSTYGSGGGSSDSEDFDGAETSTPDQEYIVLPMSNVNKTYSSVAMMAVSQSSPWIMHELVEGKPGTISVLVVRGRVKAFVARTAIQQRNFSTATKRQLQPQSSKFHVEHDVKEWQQHEKTVFLNPSSTIGQALLHYAKDFVATLPEYPSTHLNLHFFLTDRTKPGGAEQRIVATGCDFNFSPVLAQQAVVGGISRNLGNAYIDNDVKGGDDGAILLLPVIQAAPSETYTFPSVMFGSIIFSFSQALRLRGSLNGVVKGLAEVFGTLAFGHEVLFDQQDPIPWLWFWLVRKPFGTVYQGVIGIM